MAFFFALDPAYWLATGLPRGVAWIAGLALVDTGAEESEFLTFLTAATVCYLKHPALEEPVTHTPWQWTRRARESDLNMFDREKIGCKIEQVETLS